MPLPSLRRIALATVVVSLVPAAAALAGGTSRVTLDEFSVKASPKSISAGKVKFSVKNAGSDEHELVVLRTNTAASKLKVSGGRARTSGEVAAIKDIAGGRSKSRTVTLKKGHYALICNLPGHYQQGMRTDLTVR
jgi:uncharacterized cupredoxin-like copper-binding protein